MVRHAREETEPLHPKSFKKRLTEFFWSKRALTIPVTYLILFASLMAIISATYSLAIVKISARGAYFKASVAKQNMQALDDALRSVAWSFGASQVVYMEDCGGAFKVEPTAKALVINLTDEQAFSEIVFNSSVGRVLYELEPSEIYYDGAFLRGDDRPIINQSSSTISQLYAASGEEAKILVLCYRPLAIGAVIGSDDGKPLNLIRINILNLNSSQALTLREKFYLKIASLNVTTITSQYTFDYAISSLALKVTFDGTSGVVWLPISSSLEGAYVNLEVTICNLKISIAEV
ncbi:MAG: hypothetical protein ACUVTB_03180 [Candidatus Bathycorpusculaceae bacterium]